MTPRYHAIAEAGEGEAALNLRVPRRAMRDFNWFISATGREVGRRLWVMEFQSRGVSTSTRSARIETT